MLASSFEGIRLWKSMWQQLHYEKTFRSNILFILYFHGGWWLGNLSGIRICKEMPQCKLTKGEVSVGKWKEKHPRHYFNPSMSCRAHFFFLKWMSWSNSVLTDLVLKFRESQECSLARSWDNCSWQLFTQHHAAQGTFNQGPTGTFSI